MIGRGDRRRCQSGQPSGLPYKMATRDVLRSGRHGNDGRLGPGRGRCHRCGLIFAISRIKDATDQWVASTDKAVPGLPRTCRSSTCSARRWKRTPSGRTTRTGRSPWTTSWDFQEQAGQQPRCGTARFGAMNGRWSARRRTCRIWRSSSLLSGTARTVGANVNYLATLPHLPVRGAGARPGSGREPAASPARQRGGRTDRPAADRQPRQGLGAMSAPAGVVGNDMEALGIPSQLAARRCPQLNQAWDAWMSVGDRHHGLTSPRCRRRCRAWARTRPRLGVPCPGRSARCQAAATGMTYTLKGMGQDAMQSWQQLTSAAEPGNSALDQLRTGMAEGVVTGGPVQVHRAGPGRGDAPVRGREQDGHRDAVQSRQRGRRPVTTCLKQFEEWAGVKGPAAAKQFADGHEQRLAGDG